MTVEEAIIMDALLRLPKAWSREKKIARAEEVISTLRLGKCRHTLIGSPANLMHGVSGGERKRTSVAMALLTDPAVLVLDEPTSGLDSFIASTLVNTLRKIAVAGNRTVCFTVHQPGSDLYQNFDRVMLLLQGDVVFHGARPRAVEYFREVSPAFECPPFFNPPDFFFMNVLHDASAEVDGADLSPAELAEMSQLRDATRHAELSASWVGSADFQACKSEAGGGGALTGADSLGAGREAEAGIVSNEPAAGFLMQFALLAKRALRNIARDKMRLRANVAQGLIVSIIFGILWLDIKDTQAGLQDRTGLLFILCVESFMTSMMGVLSTFANERAAVTREMSHGLYKTPAYFLSKVLVESILAVIKPVIGSNIVYWMTGLKRAAVNYFTYLLCQMSCIMVGMSCGYSIAASFKDLSVALAVVPVIFMPMMVFAGLFNNLDDMPAGVEYIQYLSPMKYIYSALMQNEFKGLVLKPAVNGDGFTSGTAYLHQMGLDELSILECLLVTALITVLLLAIAFVNMRRLTTRKLK
mmetsp:Transcript_26784/g.85999  ORF Transcript_26784/g.85999 Transcript_26784/m.85999 type:complete len:527 (-) Transcript_26784:120-1700(-)